MKISNHLHIRDFQKVIIGNESIELEDSLLERVNASFQFLKEFSKKTNSKVSYVECPQTSDFLINIDKLADEK